MKVKICGISEVQHGLVALEAGADFLGFIFYPPSHRYVAPELAARIVATCRGIDRPWQAVGVFVDRPLPEVNATAELVGLDLVQLAGAEDADYCAGVVRPVIKVVRVDERGNPTGPVDAAAWNAHRILLDTDRPGHYGGTGEAYDWAAVRPFAEEAILAGGLRPSTVGAALRHARPWGLDVSSGLERERRKDPELIRAFLREVQKHGVAR